MNTIFSQIYYYHPFRSFGWSLIMFLIWLVIIGILVYLIVYFLANHQPNPQPKHQADLLEIAKTRYAKGEIDKDQFTEIKKELLT